MSKRQEKQAHWKEVIEKYQSSGLSQKKYCKEHNLSFTTFKYYFYKLSHNQKQQAANYQPIKLITTRPSNTERAIKFDIKFPNGMQCSTPSTATREQTMQLLEVLCRF